ncbi:TPA: hypothetical protein I9Z29_000921 [Clostridium perfringens]|nr:hypothetical protein [Clostridium perfringens]MDK0979435.1 hypothetical protein [Clostridium perfringens]MDU3019704.1 hypothetical protein [Clostridium perfringens]HAT4071044.1 hypothetical protein [Clostridium perfringens]
MENIFESDLYKKLNYILENKNECRKNIDKMKNIAKEDNSCTEELYKAIEKADKYFKRVDYESENLVNLVTKLIEGTVYISNSLSWYIYYLDITCINRVNSIWKESLDKYSESDEEENSEFNFNEIIKCQENEEKVKETDYYFSNLIKSNLNEIKELIKINFPERIFFLNNLFTNFEEKKYLESILIGMTQADGICKDIFKCKLYSKKDKRLILEKKLINLFGENYEKESCDFTYLQIYSLSKMNSLTENENKNEKQSLKSIKFNRHRILHGLEVDKDIYNETNCLKIISLLASLAKANEYKKEYSDKGEKNM